MTTKNTAGTKLKDKYPTWTHAYLMARIADGTAEVDAWEGKGVANWRWATVRIYGSNGTSYKTLVRITAMLETKKTPEAIWKTRAREALQKWITAVIAIPNGDMGSLQDIYNLTGIGAERGYCPEQQMGTFEGYQDWLKERLLDKIREIK